MDLIQKNRSSNLILVLASFVVVSLILWNTNSFFRKFKEEERLKMEIWASAQSEFLSLDPDADIGNLHLRIFRSNTTTPMILINKDGSIKTNNIPQEKSRDSSYLHRQMKKFSGENRPIQIRDGEEQLATLYYGNSEVLNKLKYYPLALLLIIFLFGAVIFFFFKTNKAAEQNRLWAGMAKETAHQIGTPLSSLLGWNELLKSEQINPEITGEIEKDIARLETITERFSKIGSLPTLGEHDVVKETREAYEYLRLRSSNLVQFTFRSGPEALTVMLNPALYHWTIENLVKNGIDAMRGKGQIAIEITRDQKYVNIMVSDTGHGIPKKDHQNIFNPGVTTKKRGWGLGLSLVKRIIEEYHQGRIKVFSSGKEGTVMQVSLRIKR